MCTNSRFVLNRYTGREIFVPCGTCPACKQSKAIKRANKIKANYSSNNDGNITCLFITLTYETRHIPYIHYVELDNSSRIFNLAHEKYRPKLNFQKRTCCGFATDSRILDNTALDVPDLSEYRFVYHTQILRDSKPYFSSCGKKNFRSLFRGSKTTVLDDLYVGEFQKPLYMKFLRGQTSDRVGVLYYKDLQNFFKRFRNVLQRNYGITDRFSYFSCSEYGPKTQRPHFHILLWCPTSLREAFKAAVCAAWPYADFKRTYGYIEVARDAASYVAGYVNCGTELPALLAHHKQIRPRHSHSLHFGQSLEFLQFPKILEAIRSGDMHVTVSRYRKGALVNDTILLPKYSLNRFFPKFKGYSRLASESLKLIYRRPSIIYQFYEELGLSLGDAPKIITRLTHAKEFANSWGINDYDFADLCVRAWYVRSQNILSDFYTDVLPSNPYYAYDNIKDLFDCKVSSPSLEDFYEVNPPPVLILDPNAFPERVSSTFNLTTAYYLYAKDRKVRNTFYSNFDYTF